MESKKTKCARNFKHAEWHERHTCTGGPYCKGNCKPKQTEPQPATARQNAMYHYTISIETHTKNMVMPKKLTLYTLQSEKPFQEVETLLLRSSFEHTLSEAGFVCCEMCYTWVTRERIAENNNNEFFCPACFVNRK